MAYNEQLSNRLREALADQPVLEEKTMFGGICYMVNDKMCIGVSKDEIMCRIDPAKVEEVIEMPGVRPMDFTGKSMKGFVFVDESAVKKKKELDYWVNLCLEYNPKAKSSKKKK